MSAGRVCRAFFSFRRCFFSELDIVDLPFPWPSAVGFPPSRPFDEAGLGLALFHPVGRSPFPPDYFI